MLVAAIELWIQLLNEDFINSVMAHSRDAMYITQYIYTYIMHSKHVPIKYYNYVSLYNLIGIVLMNLLISVSIDGMFVKVMKRIASPISGQLLTGCAAAAGRNKIQNIAKVVNNKPKGSDSGGYPNTLSVHGNISLGLV